MLVEQVRTHVSVGHQRPIMIFMGDRMDGSAGSTAPAARPAHHVPTQGAAEAGGADGFLAKPFRSKDLLALIASWVDAGSKA